MKALFIAAFAPIVQNLPNSHAFYVEGLGVSLEGKIGDYNYTEKLPGTRHFALWPLALCAEACFGKKEWPSEIPIPHAAIEFEVDDVEAAAKELQAKGHRLIHPPKVEPWGQTLIRLLSPEGLLVGIGHTPVLHENK